ncbi:hypothetical protein ACFV5N_09390 [Streptomyces sp. NPDC059853]|uniref:hypothetical protein n=1 Tax=Streptomyces sp. NPDC059853 TaxID=3346973 RepID=UPI003653A410
MNQPTYTNDDLVAEAAKQHHGLTEDPGYMGVAEAMEDSPIASSPDGTTWGALIDKDSEDSDEYDEARDTIHDLMTDAADTSYWAITLGQDRLVPSEQTITLGPSGDPRVRVHLAFAEDYSEADQADLIAQLHEFIATSLT